MMMMIDMKMRSIRLRRNKLYIVEYRQNYTLGLDATNTVAFAAQESPKSQHTSVSTFLNF
jgi:hypothetical protein